MLMLAAVGIAQLVAPHLESARWADHVRLVGHGAWEIVET